MAALVTAVAVPAHGLALVAASLSAAAWAGAVVHMHRGGRRRRVRARSAERSSGATTDTEGPAATPNALRTPTRR